jgi:hypothetical protein
VGHAILSFEWLAKMFSLKETVPSDGDKDSILSMCLSLMNINPKPSKYEDKYKADRLVDFLWDDGFLYGELKASMIDRVRKHVRSHVFTPVRILKAMDLAGFQLTLTGLEVLRRIELKMSSQ